MNYEVEFTVLSGASHKDVRVAWIYADSLTECKEIAEEMASQIEAPEGEIVLHIGELEQ